MGSYMIVHETGGGPRRVMRDLDQPVKIMTFDSDWDAWAAASKLGLQRPMVVPIKPKK